MSDSPTESTSEPIKKAALTVGGIVSTVVGLLGTAVSLGVISSEQADMFRAVGEQVNSAIPQLVTALVLSVGLVSGIASSLATAWHARKSTVPADSDRFDIVPKVDPAVGPLDH